MSGRPLEERVAVTGLGVVCPLGIGREATWLAAREGRSGAGPITRFDASAHGARIACEVEGHLGHGREVVEQGGGVRDLELRGVHRDLPGRGAETARGVGEGDESGLGHRLCLLHDGGLAAAEPVSKEHGGGGRAGCKVGGQVEVRFELHRRRVSGGGGSSRQGEGGGGLDLW